MLGRPYSDAFHSVIRPTLSDWRHAAKYSITDDLLSLSDEQLAAVDPLAINLIVAQEMDDIDHLDIRSYQQIVNSWAEDFADRCLPAWETHFHAKPDDFDNQLTMFRLGMITQYLEQCCQIRYDRALAASPATGAEDDEQIRYTHASQLFVHGLIDTRLGTCGNMAALQVAIGWRLGWAVSLATVRSHFVMRYDDGCEVFNIETSSTGTGGWGAFDDEHLIECYDLPLRAIACGSDLRAVTPREMLGLFLGLRARIYENTYQFGGAERDYLQARALFPNNRNLAYAQMQVSLQQAAEYFEPGERSHPNETAAWLMEVCQMNGWPVSTARPEASARSTSLPVA